MTSLSQESVLDLLVSEGGRVRKSELVRRFKGCVDSCADPAGRERNREEFKQLVNNVAVVKEVDGVRYVVIRKVYQHLLLERDRSDRQGEPERRTGEGGGEEQQQQQQQQQQQRPPAVEPSSAGEPASTDPEPPGTEGAARPTELLSPVQQALRRSQAHGATVKRALNFGPRASEPGGDKAPSKPYALPLRVAPCRVETHPLKEADPPETPSRCRRGPPPVEGDGAAASPHPGRAPKSAKPPLAESPVPLDQAEHEWLVRCAAGHWSQVHGLLLRDHLLAHKRDFTSGFSALHWAAKEGNGDMLLKIVELSRKGGAEPDVNAKAHGGYTPLHIAALHRHEGVMAVLVGQLGADARLRDNGGKRAYHYLHQGASKSLRQMLGEPEARPAAAAVPAPDCGATPDREEPELLADLSRGLHSISRLFQPHATGHKKKHKQRPSFYSLSEGGEEREDGGETFRNRLMSDVFM